jgi:hypothetical protein
MSARHPGFWLERASTKILFKHLDQPQKPYYMFLCAQRWLNLVLDIVGMGLATIVVALAVELHNTTTAWSPWCCPAQYLGI